MAPAAAAPPFAASRVGQLKVDAAIRPTYNVLSVADLENSPWVVVADGKGVISTWYIGHDMDVDEPDHVLEAHTGPIHTVITLRSNRLPDVVEEMEWPEIIPGVPRKLAPPPAPALKDDASVSTAASPGRPNSPDDGPIAPDAAPRADAAADARRQRRDSSSTAATSEVDEEQQPPPRGFRGLLRRMCACCSKKKGKRRRKPKKYKRAEQKHWLIATAGEDGFVRIWRYRPVDLKRSLKRDDEFEPLEVDYITEWNSRSHIAVTRIMELHDGHLALALKGSPDVRILDPVTSQVKSVLFGHTGQVLSMAAIADGRLVTGGADGSVRLWATRTWGSEAEEALGRTRGLAAVEDAPEPRSAEVAVAVSGQAVSVPGQVGEDTSPPPQPALGWVEPDQEPAGAGVSNMAFYAHMQQAAKGESLNLALRVYVVCAESLPKGGTADPYVHCCVMEGEQHDPAAGTTMRTFSKAEPIWYHRCCLPLRQSLVDGAWQLPECSWLDFEVFYEPRSRGSSEILLGHCSMLLDEVMASIKENAVEAAHPQPRKLYAPAGEGPYNELKASVLNVGFEQLAPETLDCTIASAEGLPQGLNGTVYVRVHIRQALPGTSRRLPPPRYREKTRVIRRSASPFFDDVLELEVPVHLTDRQLVYGPELCLRLEVFDNAAQTSEDLMATVNVPLATALQADGQDPHPYNLTLAPSARSQKKRSGGLGLNLFGLRKAAAAEKDIIEEGLAELAPLSRLHLGFQAILPCPKQLRCTVEYARGVPTVLPASPSAGVPVSRGTFSPIVRMSFVEGNPLPAHATVARTKIWKQPLKPVDVVASPVWDEKCFLTLPNWIWEVSLSKHPPDPQRLSVREGWEHPHRDEMQEAVVCVDVYDRDPLGCDKFLGRAIVPFSHAYNAARAGTGHQPRPVNLSCLPDSFLWLGFELGAYDDQFVVIVAHADELPVDPSSGQAAMSCIVRIAELGAFYAPTDKADVNCVAKVQTAVGQGHPRDPVWQHEELLELPGGEVDSVVAVRPNWYMLFEVIDSDPRSADAPPLAVAAAPLADVLSQSYEAQAPEKTSPELQKRIEKARSPIKPAKTKIAAVPGSGISATVPIVRELPLVLRKTTLEGQEQEQPAVPAKGLKNRFGQKTKSLTKMLSSTKKLDVGSLPESPATALPLEDGIHDGDRVLVVRFEVLSRWKGTGGGAKCPPTRPMMGPSPVMSLVPLISTVVAGHENGNIFVWDVTGSSNIPLHQFHAHKAPISCMVHLPMLDCIISTAMPMNRKEAVSESLLRVWSSSAFELRQTLPLHGSGSRCLIPLQSEGKGGSFVLALGKDSRQSSLLQFFKLDAA